MAPSAAALMIASRSAAAKVSFGGNDYPAYGKYRLQVQVLRAKNGQKGLSAAADFKVITSERTKANDDHKVSPSSIGADVSYVENFGIKGADARWNGFLLRLMGMEEVQLGRDEEKKQDWYVRFYDEKIAPAAYLLIDCEVFPKHLAPKEGKPGKIIDGYRWTNVELTDEQVAEVEALRKAGGLCSLEEAVKFLAPPA